MTEPKFFADLYDLDGKVICTVNLASVGNVYWYKGRWFKSYLQKKRRLYEWNKDKWPWWKPKGIKNDGWLEPEWEHPKVVIQTWETKWNNELATFKCRSNRHAFRLCGHIEKQLERFKYET